MLERGNPLPGDDDNQCPICYDHQITKRLPCGGGHGICGDCHARMVSLKESGEPKLRCPICRGPFWFIDSKYVSCNEQYAHQIHKVCAGATKVRFTDWVLVPKPDVDGPSAYDSGVGYGPDYYSGYGDEFESDWGSDAEHDDSGSDTGDLGSEHSLEDDIE